MNTTNTPVILRKLNTAVRKGRKLASDIANGRTVFDFAEIDAHNITVYVIRAQIYTATAREQGLDKTHPAEFEAARTGTLETR